MSPIVGSLASSSAQGYGGLRSFVPATAFESIATVTASGGETSLTLSSIPNTYKHLQIRGLYKDTTSVAAGRAEYRIRFNGSSSGYNEHFLIGNGTTTSATASAPGAQIKIPASGLTSHTSLSSMFGVSIVDIHDYASTTKYKVTRSFAGCQSGIVSNEYQTALGSGLWSNTAAINSITFLIDGTAFAAGTTFDLYGIKGA